MTHGDLCTDRVEKPVLFLNFQYFKFLRHLSIYSKISPVIVCIPSSSSSVVWTVGSSQMCDIFVFFSNVVRNCALSLMLTLYITLAHVSIVCASAVTKVHRRRNLQVSDA